LPESSGNDCRARLTARCGWTGPEGRVRLEPAGDAAGLPEPWVEAGLELRFRAGGERFKPARRMHSLPLKQWLQERGIVPWMRRRIPLLYRQDRLVAVADLAVAAEAADAEPGAPRWRLVWTDHPPVS
jgi:tRNA(Ile)-lysidine synthase